MTLCPELTGREIDIECLVNLYKDRYGVRPRHYDFDNMTDDALQNEIERISALPCNE